MQPSRISCPAIISRKLNPSDNIYSDINCSSQRNKVMLRYNSFHGVFVQYKTKKLRLLKIHYSVRENKKNKIIARYSVLNFFY